MNEVDVIKRTCPECGHEHFLAATMQTAAECISKLEVRIDALTSERDEIVGRIAIESAYERTQFIRDTAITIYARRIHLTSPEQTWALAKVLWDAKPEDC